MGRLLLAPRRGIFMLRRGSVGGRRMGLMGRDVVGRYDFSLFLLGPGQLVF